MRNLTLIKTHPNVQLGHLYEHLFVCQIDAYFYQHHLFESIDYLSRGTTYEQAGVITIDIDFHTDEAWSHKDALLALPLELGENATHVTQMLHQIEAEEPERLHITDKRRVLDELHALDKQPWQPIDSYSLLDTKTKRRQYQPIYLTNRKQAKKRTIHTTLSLDEKFLRAHRQLAPLFNVVGRFILRTIDNRATAHFGFYSGDLSGTPRPLTVTNDMLLIPHTYKPVDSEEILRFSRETANFMLDDSTIGHIADELQRTSYESSVDNAPDVKRLLNETDVLIGSHGWQTIATPENIRQLLTNSTLTTRYGRQKATSLLTDTRD